MEARFCPLFSGSAGNAIYIGTENTHILVDAGLSGKRVEQALCQIGVRPDQLSAILVTHEHSDHIRGIGVLARRHRLPVYANEGTWAAMEGMLGEVPASQRRVFYNERDFYIGPIGVEPYCIPHDAADPVGYCFYMGEKKISIATDLGHTKPEILDRIAESDILLLEANHDVDMLERCARYPASLKRRIRGRRGHLSNEQCAQALLTLVERGVGCAVLGHLSDQSNTPELAYGSVTAYLTQNGVHPGRDIQIGMAWRDHAGDLLNIR